MAEYPTEPAPDDDLWLPAPGGARLLRAHAGATLVLATRGGERRIADRGGGEYLVPAELVSTGWDAAWLEPPSGAHASLPPLPHAEIVSSTVLAERRARRDAAAAAPSPAPTGGASSPSAAIAGGASPAAAAAAPSPPPTGGASPPAAIAASLVAREESTSSGDTPAWTAPPPVAFDATTVDPAWRERRADLERELARAADALVAARDAERTDREAVLAALAAAEADVRAARAARDAEASTVVVLTGELEAERVAHAVTRARVATLASELGLAREQLRETNTGTLLDRVAQLDRDAAGLRDQVEHERRAREHAEAAATAARRPAHEAGRLVADLDAAAAALRAAAAPPPGDVAPPPADATPPLADAAPAGEIAPVDDAAAADATAPLAPRPPARYAPAHRRLTRRPRHLRLALVSLAREDAFAAGELLAALLPAQHAIVAGPLSYDLTIREIGTFAVTLEDGQAAVERIAEPRRRRHARFELDVNALTLAQLLAGERCKLARFGPRPKLKGRRRRARPLQALPASALSLTAALNAGARLEPRLVYDALPFVIDPEWTRGYVFTVAQEVVDETWFVSARDGARVHVTQDAPPAPPHATVTMTAEAFQRLLRGEPAEHGARPVVRGDLAAVAALKSWTDRARG